MASKTEMWSAFEHFDVSNLDCTFKRNPGLYFREANAEESPSLERPSRGRTQSTPPDQSAAWAFHHRVAPSNEQRRGPMRHCRSSEDCSYDKVTASLACDLFGCTGYVERPMSKRRPGQFSPEALASGSQLTSTHVSVDFQSRGVCDIDRNLKRGVGCERRASETTLGNEQNFSEERHCELKDSLSKLSGKDQFQALPEFVRDLSKLGIECRRLQSSNFSQAGLHWSSGAGKDVKVRETSKKFTPVLVRDSVSRLKQRVTSKQARSKLADELNDCNINSQRLASVYASDAVPHIKLPKGALSKSLKKLLTEASEKRYDADSTADTCSTRDEEFINETEFQIPKIDLRGLAMRESRVALEITTPPSSPSSFMGVSPTSASS